MSFIANSLFPNIQFWEHIGASQTVIDWIKNGIPVTFNSEPCFELPNHKLTPIQSDFVNNELKNLLKWGVIARSTNKPICVSPLGVVPKKRNKFRLILDLRQLNLHCEIPKFRYEDIGTVLDIIKPHDQFITADLQNGFYHLSIRPTDQKYFGFCWCGKYYVFCALPFGWKGSPYYFHKTVRPLIGYLRQSGIRITSYVDDFLILSHPDSISEHKTLFLKTIQSLGWQLNFEKCKLDPASKREYIGFILDTTGQQGTPSLKVPHLRIRKVRKDILRLLASDCFSARRLAVILGQCVSMAKAILPAKLLLRNAYRLLSTRCNWDSKIMVLDQATRKDLTWWVQSLQQWNGIVFKHRANAMQISTDASGSGWGGYLHNRHLSARGHWDRSMKLRASNYREIMAVYLNLKSFAPHLKGSAVTVLSDNVTATAYLNHMGGPRQAMTLVAQAVWALAHQLDISLTVRFLAGKDNQIADQLSRAVDQYEWRLHSQLFRRLDKAFGPHTVDRFASLQSTQLPRYNAAFHDPGAEAIDALSQNWAGEMNFANPPFRLLHRVLHLIQDQGAQATVIAPWWPSQPWFKLLENMSIAIPIRLPNTHKAIRRLSGLPEPLRNKQWRIYAWRVSGLKNLHKMASRHECRPSILCDGQLAHVRPTTDSYTALHCFMRREASHFMK